MSGTPRSLYFGIVLTTIILSISAPSDAQAAQSIKCRVCNSAVPGQEKCGEGTFNETVEVISCDDEFMKMVFGGDGTGEDLDDGLAGWFAHFKQGGSTPASVTTTATTTTTTQKAPDQPGAGGGDGGETGAGGGETGGGGPGGRKRRQAQSGNETATSPAVVECKKGDAFCQPSFRHIQVKNGTKFNICRKIWVEPPNPFVRGKRKDANGKPTKDFDFKNPIPDADGKPTKTTVKPIVIRTCGWKGSITINGKTTKEDELGPCRTLRRGGAEVISCICVPTGKGENCNSGRNLAGLPLVITVAIGLMTVAFAQLF